MKICNKCKIIKNFNEFTKDKNKKDKLCTICRECRINYRELTKKARSDYAKENYRKKIEYNKIRNKKYREENKEKIKLLKKNYRKNNKEKLKIYEKATLERRKELHKIRLKANPDKKIRHNISSNLSKLIKDPKDKKEWYSALEYTMCELKKHLESKFTKGMSWGNYGKNGWHIDHIIPHSYFKYNSTKHPAFKACWALNNLQPLWATTEIAMMYGEGDNYIGNLNKLNKVILTKDIEELLNRVNIVSI